MNGENIEAINCYTKAISLNDKNPVYYSNRKCLVLLITARCPSVYKHRGVR